MRDPSAFGAPIFERAERWIEPFDDAGPEAERGELPADALGFVRHFLGHARWPFVAFLVLSGLVGLIETSLFWFVGLLIDMLNATRPADVWSEWGWAFAGMALLVAVARVLAWTGNALVEEQAIVPGFFQFVRWHSHRSVMGQSYRFFSDDFAGRIATKVMQSGQALGDLLISALNSLWTFVVFAVTSTAIFASLNPWLALLLVAWFGTYLAMVLAIMPSVRARAKTMSNQRSVVNGRLVDSYTNIATVKLFAGERQEDAFVADGIATMWDAVRLFTRLLTTLRFLLTVLNGLMLVGLAYLSIRFWQAGAMTTGEIAIVLGLALRLNNMSGWMMFQINAIFRDFGTVQDAVATISQPRDLNDREGAPAISTRTRGELRYEDVTFHYGKGEGGLEGLDLTVAPGEKIGIVGRSGAGKTTLMNVTLRLYDLEGGRILLDGTDIASVTQASLRRRIGVVTQDTALLHRSVADNIAYGSPDATRDDVERAARRAKAHDFIPGLRDVKGRRGYDAHVGERGVKLSGGQRQRIAIARIFLKDAPILMLDEATSALDSEVEAAIQENLLDLMEGKTVIAIAHRLSTIAHLDRLIVMDQGRIVEEGTHSALVARGGLYADLWARQSGGFLEGSNAAPAEAAE